MFYCNRCGSRICDCVEDDMEMCVKDHRCMHCDDRWGLDG